MCAGTDIVRRGVLAVIGHFYVGQIHPDSCAVTSNSHDISGSSRYRVCALGVCQRAASPTKENLVVGENRDKPTWISGSVKILRYDDARQAL